VGVNYREHFSEVEDVLDNPNIPKFPVIFSKAPTTVIGPNTMVKRYAEIISQLDYEVELAVIIGTKGTKIKKEVAYDYIFGYTILNDISARDLQFRHGQWFLGKSCDTFAPMGPWIVHKSALSNPQELDIQCRINGELRQSNNTKNMIFDIPTIIETISSVITLEPGDIIATGTPSGVGLGFNPPKYLQAGDIMELWIEKIGVLTNIIEGI
jgi:2-keto-4-pentenoate hydratase/2-oxohepta-3-ene-1,7-dioic acid hydratase in catechol pathway